MEDWINEAPLAVLMLVALLAFLKFLSAERKERREMSIACHSQHKETTDRWEKGSGRTNECIDRNTRVMGRLDERLRKLNGEPGSPVKL